MIIGIPLVTPYYLSIKRWKFKKSGYHYLFRFTPLALRYLPDSHLA